MINTEKFFQIAQDLEVFHGIFSQIWQMGKPVVDETIPTAAVRFDKEGGFFSFCFNPDFFNKLDDYNLKFVICHESLHVILNHGLRGMNMEPELANRAMDIVINESLVANFGFDRSRILNGEEYCWYDTIFKPSDNIELEKSFEYYYELMYEKALDQIGNMIGQMMNGHGGAMKLPHSMGGKQKTVDQHEGFGSENQDEIDQKIEEACDALGNEESKKLKEILGKLLDEQTKQSLQRGDGVGGLTKIMSPTPVPKKRKWETVIKKWAENFMKRNDKNNEQWARTNRRFVTLPRDMFIPTEMEIDSSENEKHKIKVLFFLDTSGSCAHLADRFWKAAKSLPEDRFIIQLCCFDTKVYETSLKTGKLYGFGGTSFHILEDYAQKYRKEKNKGRYPDAVFVITDGYGTPVKPEFSKRWSWFLSENYKACIPKECNIYDLKDYE
jgi:predicted metal-dependent peptidase